MSLLLGVSFATAAFLIVRALLVEGRAPSSAWRDQTFGRQPANEPSAPSIRPGAAMLRSRSLVERLANAVPRLQSPAEGLVTRAGLAPRFSGAWLVGVSAAGAVASALTWLLSGSSGGFDSTEMMLIPVFAVFGGSVPWVLVSGRAKRRQQAIERALPDTLR
jgi:Flp pilus assembly protein TadB